MALFEERFDVWQAADLAAYEPRKWSSKRFNLERGRVRSRLISLLEQIASAAALHTEGLEIWTSRDHPNIFNSHRVDHQWAVWCRPLKSREHMGRLDATLSVRRALDCHLHLGVQISGDGLRLVFCLPAGARFDQSLRADLLASLGDQGAVDADGEVRVEVRHSAEDLLGGSATLAEVQTWVESLWPAFRAGLWHPDNDPQGLAVAPPPAAVEPVVAEAAAGEPIVAEPVVPEPAAARPTIAPPRSRTPDPADLSPPRRPGVAPPRSAAGRERRSPPPAPSRSAPPRSSQQRPRREPRGPRPDQNRGPYQVGPERSKKRFEELAPGATVRVKGGLFAGKRAVVDAINGDRLQLTVGIMSLSVGRDEVELA